MKNKKGFTLVELMAVIVVLAIIIAIAVPSYTKIKRNIDEKNYKNKVNLIEIAAEKYTEDTHYETVFVEDLIKDGYLDADDVNGVIYNDLKTDNNGNKETLNCYVVQSKNENGIYYGNLLEDTQFIDELGNCVRNDLNEINSYVSIKMYESGTSNKITNETKYWTKNNVDLVVELSEDLQGAEIKWYKGYSQTPEATNKEKITVETTSVLQENYTVVATKGDKTFNSSARVYIDKITPKFYGNDAKNLNNKWVTELKYGIKAYDNESGIYGYYFNDIDNTNTCSNNKKDYNSNKNKTINQNGEYLVCLMDNVGNFSGKIIELTNVDPVDMECKIEVSSCTKGNVINDIQWYIGKSLTLKVTPEQIGPSGVSLGIAQNDTAIYNTGFIKKEDQPQYTTTITSNQNEKTYYGYVKNQAGTADSCNTKVYYEKSITKPVLASTTNSYDTITVTYKDESAISGIKETKCYLTDVNGTVIKEGTVAGLKCKFSVTATKNNTTYYFKRCITSNAGNITCSTVNSKSNIGYCTSGHYSWSGNDKKIVHDIYLNDGSIPSNINQYVTYCRTGYNKSKYKSLACSNTTTQYCSSGYGTGTCSTSYTSITRCSILDFRTGGGVGDYEISTTMPSYFSLSNRSDLGNWHVATFQSCVNGNETSGGYPCSTGTDSRYRKDGSGNIHEWY